MNSLTHAIANLLEAQPGITDIQLQQEDNIEYRNSIGEMQLFEPETRHSAESLVEFLDVLEMRNPIELRNLINERGGDINETVVVGEFRFRANVYLHGGAKLIAATLRPIRTVRSMKELGIAPSICEWADHRAGLILVTGPSGHGKSTTLAAIIDYINRARKDHILTIEDPIEYEHDRIMSSIRHREVGVDTTSFDQGIRAGLRQNPNVIVVGEIRDRKTMETVLSASETGHLVLATLHSTSAIRAPERVVDFFPEEAKALARSQLSSSLIGVLTQVLVPRADKKGKALATEAMANLGDIQALIRDGKFEQLKQSVSQPGARSNTWLLNTKLYEMVNNGVITHDAAIDAAYDREEMRARLNLQPVREIAA